MRPILSPRLARSSGFTMLEMVIVIGVLAILVAISTPAVYKFMLQRDVQNEENALAEIHKAMEAYIADKGELPYDTYASTSVNFWAQKLAGYTNLSENAIANDTWGRPRMYLMYKSTQREIMGTQIPVFYATVFSMGPDATADNKDSNGKTIPGIALSGKNFAGSTAAAWWKGSSFANDTAKINAFAGLSGGGDDLLMRFTDYAAKLDAYNKTLDRLDRLGQAIETYARSGYAEKTVACASTPTAPSCINGMPEKYIYYPRSYPSSGPADTATYYRTGYLVYNTSGDAARRNQMKNLVRLLGLPDDFCCSALELGSDKEPKPFYYFSNPRARLSNGKCAATRPGLNNTKLPARLSTVNNPDSSANPTCG